MHVSHDHEPVWPGIVAVLVAGALNIFLPENLSAGPGWLAVLLIAAMSGICAILPTGPHHWAHQALGHASSGLVTVALCYSLWKLIEALLYRSAVNGADLLRGALILWSINIVLFGTWYWRLDAGGPHRRSAKFHSEGAFLFPQMSMDEPARQAARLTRWRPGFLDYLFLAFNTSTAFSPTDTLPLSRWAKVLMMMQSSISLTILAVVAARAVNIIR